MRANNLATTDFRDQKWSFTEVPVTQNGFDTWQPTPRRGFGAAYGEAVFDLDGQPFTLSTQIRIFGRERAERV